MTRVRAVHHDLDFAGQETDWLRGARLGEAIRDVLAGAAVAPGG